MRLSVIIPARNEEAWIGPTLRRVLEADPWEVIVVDGGSGDGTVDLAREAGATVLRSAPGRARQMNAGAVAATGRVLMFLHADTMPPPAYDRIVARTLAGVRVAAGAFGLRIGGAGRGFRMIERMVNARARRLQMPYGDQGLFLKAALFWRVGGFPDLPVMEDFALMRKLRRRGRIETATETVITSPRRWERHGLWRTTLINQACVVAHLLGVPAHRIARWRGSDQATRRSPDRVAVAERSDATVCSAARDAV